MGFEPSCLEPHKGRVRRLSRGLPPFAAKAKEYMQIL